MLCDKWMNSLLTYTSTQVSTSGLARSDVGQPQTLSALRHLPGQLSASQRFSLELFCQTRFEETLTPLGILQELRQGTTVPICHTTRYMHLSWALHILKPSMEVEWHRWTATQTKYR